MNDMTQVIVPKSDQISADDFIAGPRTFTIEGVAINPGTEQPVQIKLAGEDRVWRPCKSMSRVLVAGWGPDAKVYTGRSVTLYRDPKVKWGGIEVGGIRVSHMSHLDRDLALQLTATKGKRAPHVVKVLQVAPSEDTAAKWAAAYIAKVNRAPDADKLNAFANSQSGKLAELADKRPDLHTECVKALSDKLGSFKGDGFGDDWNEGPATSAQGEAHTEHELAALIAAAATREEWTAAEDAVCAATLSDDERLALSRALETRRAELMGEG